MSTATESSNLDSVTLTEPTKDKPSNSETQAVDEPEAKKAKLEQGADDSQPTRKKRGRNSQTSFERAKAEAEALTKDLPKEEGEGRRTRSKTRPPVTTPAKDEAEKPARAKRTPSKAEKPQVTTPKSSASKASRGGRRGRPPKNKTPTTDAPADDVDDAAAEGEASAQNESNVEAKSSNEIAEVKENGQVAAAEKMETDTPASAVDTNDQVENELKPSSEEKAESTTLAETVAVPTTETSAIPTKNNEPSDAISTVETASNVEAKSDASAIADPKAGEISQKVDESKSSIVEATVAE